MSDTNQGHGFTHFDAEGRARMVDVGAKPATHRVAVAEAWIALSPATFEAIRDGSIEKGAVLAVARIAGIQAAKKTSELIPLCHPLSLTRVEVDFEFPTEGRLRVTARAEVHDRTGVEMEALTACSVAALTVYDMCKAKDRGLVIEKIRLIEKTGGRSGDWRA